MNLRMKEVIYDIIVDEEGIKIDLKMRPWEI